MISVQEETNLKTSLLVPGTRLIKMLSNCSDLRRKVVHRGEGIL